MTAPLTDAQVAALREAAEKLVALEVSWHVPWRIRAGAMANGVRVEVSEYVHALSPDVILALLAERDALKDELRQWRRAANYNEARANGWVHGFDY